MSPSRILNLLRLSRAKDSADVSLAEVMKPRKQSPNPQAQPSTSTLSGHA